MRSGTDYRGHGYSVPEGRIIVREVDIRFGQSSVNRNVRAEKQSARCDPNCKGFDWPVDFSLYTAAAGEQPLSFLVHKPIGEPGAARRASIDVFDAIHCAICC